MGRVAWAFAPYAVVSVVHVAALALDSQLAPATKLLLMPLLAVPVVVARRDALVTVVLLAAIAFSWLGDGAGVVFSRVPELPLMLGFFGAAHVAYIVLFSTRGRRIPLWTLVYFAWWIGMMVVLGPYTAGMLTAVAAYGLVLAGTAVLSARGGAVAAVGGAFFLLTDSVLAVRFFLPDALPPWSDPVVMAAYAIGQGLLVAGALRMVRRRRPAAERAGSERTGAERTGSKAAERGESGGRVPTR
ncbi:lysoplasmalogenase family protein [Microbacterium sp. NPDC055683]